MDKPRHPYRKFVFAAAARSADGLFYSLNGYRKGVPVRLEPAEFELARLIDGSRDAQAVRAAAQSQLGRSVEATELEAFCNDLSQADLLIAGHDEPLPVPAQTDAEAAMAGWQRGPLPSGVAPETPPPSSVPGALTGPGLPGSLTGLWGAFRGLGAAPRTALPLSPLLPIGSLLTLALRGRVALLLLLAAVVAAIAVMWSHRYAMGVSFSRLMAPWTLVLLLVGGTLLLNLLSEVARAATIRRLTGQTPAFGLVLGVALIPRFHTDTGGPAENAPRAARLQIVGASLIAQLTLFVLGIVGWLMFRHGNSLLPSVLLGLAMIASAFFLLQVNPLVKRDGYHWLVQWFQAADLREQATYALMRYERPWNETRKLSPAVLKIYGLLCMSYIVWILLWVALFPAQWLEGAYGGVGIAIVAVLLAWTMFTASRRSQSTRGSIGPGKVDVQKPRRLDWVIIAILSTIALFPYTYEPSGAFVVLPNARADVRALTDGDVREVFRKEGDIVKAGEVIARLADDGERAAVASSEASLARLRANLAIARQGAKVEEVERARQEVMTASKKLEFSRAEAERLRRAFARKAVSDQEYQRARSVAELDAQRLQEARKGLALVASPVRLEQIQAIEADIQREQVQLDLYQKQVEAAQIKAPIAGQILSGTLRFAVGDYLRRGDQLATIQDAEQLKVEVRVPETEVGSVARGQRATAKAWAFPERGYAGTVQDIAPSAERNEYGKVVRVVMSIDTPDGQLLPEMTGQAKISAERVPLIVAFTRPIVRFFLIEVWSWLP